MAERVEHESVVGKARTAQRRLPSGGVELVPPHPRRAAPSAEQEVADLMVPEVASEFHRDEGRDDDRPDLLRLR